MEMFSITHTSFSFLLGVMNLNLCCIAPITYDNLFQNLKVPIIHACFKVFRCFALLYSPSAL